MPKDAFKDRERAIEDEFFHRVDEKLLNELKLKLATEQEIQALSEATGFTDHDLLNELVELGLSPESVMAISLVPLVLVAWADRRVDAKERPAIIKAAKDQGIFDGSPAARMLKHWLNNEPSPKLTLVWKHYIGKMRSELPAETCEALRHDFERRTRAIAKVSGGHLGFGRISEAEKQVIAELHKAFEN